MRFKRFQSEWWIVVFGKLINMFTNWFVAIVVFSREALEGQHTSKDCASGTPSRAEPMYVPWKPPIELAFTRQWETLKTRGEISLGWPHESPCLQRRQLDLDREWGTESPPYQLDPLCHLPVYVLSISLSKCKQHAEHKWRTCWDTKYKETWNRRQRILSSQRYTRAPWRIAEFRKTLPSKIGAPPPAASPTPPLFLLRASPSMSETDDTVTLSHVLLQTHHENFMKGFFKFPFKGCFVRGCDCQRLFLTETVPSTGLSSLMKQPACLSDVGQKHFWEVISTRGIWLHTQTHRHTSGLLGPQSLISLSKHLDLGKHQAMD